MCVRETDERSDMGEIIASSNKRRRRSCGMFFFGTIGALLLSSSRQVSSFGILPSVGGRCVRPSSSSSLSATKASTADRNHPLDQTNGGNSDAAKQETALPPPEMPANLRRKVRAQRPALGHVVPSSTSSPNSRRRSSNQSTTTTTKTGGSAPSFLRSQGKGDYNNGDATYTNPSRLKIAAGVARGRRLDSPNVHIRPMMGKVKEAVYSTLTSFGLYDHDASSSLRIRHLDIFAGSGSVGLESLSRGAAHCTFIDMSADCCACIQRNLVGTGLLLLDEDSGHATTAARYRGNGPMRTQHDDNNNNRNEDEGRARICCADALVALRTPTAVGIPEGATYDLITLCPPYEEVVYADLLQAVMDSPLLKDDTIVLVEYPTELKSLPPVLVSSATMKSSSSIGSEIPQRTAVGIRNRRYGRTVLALYVVNPTGRLPEAAQSRPQEFLQVA